MKTITPYNPIAHFQRTQEVGGEVVARAQQLQQKSMQGTLHLDDKYRDVMESQERWAQSNTMQQFNPLAWVAGNKEDRTLMELQQRAWMDPEVGAQLQNNLMAVQSLALADRVGVSFDSVKNFLEHTAAVAYMQGDMNSFQAYSHALAGLESAARLIPGYDQAVRSVPTHRREGETTPKGSAQRTAQAAQAGREAMKDQPSPVDSILLPNGMLQGGSFGVNAAGEDRLKFGGGKELTFPASGPPRLDGQPLSAEDTERVALGIGAWVRDPNGVSHPKLQAFASRTLDAATLDAGRDQLRSMPSLLVDKRPNIVKARIEEKPTPFSAQVAVDANELVNSPGAAARGTLLLDPAEGTVRMRTESGREFPIEDDDRLRLYQMLSSHSKPPAGFDAFLRMFENTLLAAR